MLTDGAGAGPPTVEAPLVGLIVNQPEPPESVLAAALQCRVPCPTLRTLIASGAGAAPCAVAVKLIQFGESKIDPCAELTERLTIAPRVCLPSRVPMVIPPE